MARWRGCFLASGDDVADGSVARLGSRLSSIPVAGVRIDICGIRMLAGLTWLLVFQCLGEALVRLLGAPVPGPVVGMLLLFVALRARETIPPAVDAAATGLLQHLSLLFVPAGVGVMLHFGRLADEGAAIVPALVLSTVLAIGVTALTMRALIRRSDTDGAGRGSDEAQTGVGK
jgi:holin-like protein